MDAARPARCGRFHRQPPGSFSAAAARSGGRIVGAVGDAYTAASGNWAPAEPPSSPPGRCIYRVEAPRDVEGRSAQDGDSRSALTGAGRGWRGVPGADRAAPAGASGALLPDARILRRRRGRRPGDDAGRLARHRQVHRGTRVAAHLAVQDRHQPLPQRAPRSEPAPGQGVGRVAVRTARADTARRGRLAAAVPRLPPRGCRRRAPRAGGPLRAERSDLACLRDRPAAAAATPGWPSSSCATSLDSTPARWPACWR